jgi:SAM-dependent methyltransferase
VEEIVRQGYDLVGEDYLAQRDRFESIRYLDRLLAHLPPGATVLDVGCGAGVPIDEYVIGTGRKVIGIDISAKQIALARREVPQGQFDVRDMLWLTPGEYRVDAIVSFYAIFHIPRERHEELLRTLGTFVSVSGWLLITMGSGEWEGVEHDFHGGTMAWSHFGPERNHAMLERAGFEVVLDEIDARAGERHQILLARKL